MLTKSQIGNLMEILAVGSMTAIGFAIGHPIAMEAIKGIGLNLASNLIQKGSTRLRENWFTSDNGILNHDLQQAFVRAFIEASTHLEKEYFRITDNLSQKDRLAVEYLFRQFREQAYELFLASNEFAISDEELKICLYSDERSANSIVWNKVESSLVTYGADLRNFLRENMLKTTVFCFGEELKKDTEAGNRAWRAFQRLLLESIRSELFKVNENQALVLADLRKLDYLANDLRALNDAIHREIFQSLGTDVKFIRKNLEDIQDQIRGLYDRIEPRPVFDEEQFRLDYQKTLYRVMSASSFYELNSLKPQIRYLEEKYPNHPDIHFLTHKFQSAMKFETRMTPANQASGNMISVGSVNANQIETYEPGPTLENFTPANSRKKLLMIIGLILLFGLLMLAGFVFYWLTLNR